MSFTRDTRENGDILLYDDKGGCVSLRVEKDYVRLQDILMPDGFEQGAALLGAAGTDALQRGIKRVICDFSGEQADRLRLFEDCGYELSRTDRIISVKTKELLSSVGVKKSMRKQFAGVECLPLEDLIGFQRDEIVKALAKHGYMESREQLDRFLRAALLAPSWKDYQCWNAVVLTDRGDIRRLGELLRYNPGREVFDTVPCFIVLTADPERSGEIAAACFKARQTEVLSEFYQRYKGER